ncbi:MAG: hypothetical protein ACQEWM_10900 [Actinomycetota bacterium]
MERIDTTGWGSYVSSRYGFVIGHPPGWSVTPAERSWSMEEDAGVVDSTAHEQFTSPAGDAWVSAWAAPSASEPSLEGVLRWAVEYCDESFNSDCSTIGERAVRLCYLQDGCGPGLLVPFATDVHAFFTGGEHQQRIVVVVVWRPPDFPVAGAGTARQVLDAFLSTMGVWS